MVTRRCLIAIPFLALFLGAGARGSAIRDEGRIFSPRAVEQSERRLERLEQTTNVPVVIETIEHIPGLQRSTPPDERREAINQLARQKDRQIHDEGIYILISKRDAVISQPLVRARLERVLPLEKRDAIRKSFIEEFSKKDFDGGLQKGVAAIEKALDGVRADKLHGGGARAGAPIPIGEGARRGQAGGRGGNLLGTFLLIGLGIVAVLILLRILGGLFGRSPGAGYPNQMGGMGGPRPGMGPGGPGYYGGPGYGGRGGGFFSGLLGGLGGALAGNWLYDQMSGRHGGGMTSAGAGYPADPSSAGIPDQGDDAIVGADDHGGQGGSWDDGGTDTGGGDWGGGDAGGDWGGGDAGGDWGGGGGDWGGGDAGGDWGGGGGGDW
jgi:TPM domain